MPRLPSINPVPPQPRKQDSPLPMAFAALNIPPGSLKKVGDDTVLGVAGTAFPVTSVLQGKSLLIVGRVQGNAGTVNFGPRFNGDAANNYGFFNMFSAGAGVVDGASALSNFIQGGQATNTTSAAWACFVPGHRISLINNPAISICASSLIVIVRSAWWNLGGAINTVQVVADAAMAPGSYAAVYELL